MSKQAKALSSTDPLSRTEWEIPTGEDDGDGIESFIKRNAGRPVVVVQGLGFVGAAMALVCANASDSKYAVIGVDLPTPESFWKIKAINSGSCPIVASDKKIEELYTAAFERGNLYATWDPSAYSHADVVIVDINLDVDKRSSELGEILDYDVDLTPMRRAIEVIGNNCREDALVLVETTVPPGTCQQLVEPTLKECLENRGLNSSHIAVGHSYERVMPGPHYIDSIINFYRVFSGTSGVAADRTETFLRSVINTENFPLTRLGSTNATEMAKILENSYRAMNIAFVEEWSRFAEESGVNLFEIIDAIRLRPTHKNLMYPGLGVGGYCLTKDPLLASWSKVAHFDSQTGLPRSVDAVSGNDGTPRRVAELFETYLGRELQGAKILILGVSYRSDVADTRYTPVEPFYRYLSEQGAIICLHDPFVSYWSELDVAIEGDVEKLLGTDYNAVVFCTGHSEYRVSGKLNDWLAGLEGKLIYDTVGILSEPQISSVLTSNIVKVIGRGDLS